MTRYANLSGAAGIAAYEIGGDSITIQFNSGETYLYNYASAGRVNIERMKSLAVGGKGLTTFISQVVKKNMRGNRGELIDHFLNKYLNHGTNRQQTKLWPKRRMGQAYQVLV